MTYIYHRATETIVGDVIYPLNEFRELYPDFVFAKNNHQHPFPVLTDSIPRLGCFWNDTLHFTAFHPELIASALIKHGYQLKLTYYEVSADALEPEKTIVFLNKPRTPGTPTTFSDFVDYNPLDIETYKYINEEPLERFDDLPTGDEFLLHYNTPFILYKGKLNVKDLKIIEK